MGKGCGERKGWFAVVFVVMVVVVVVVGCGGLVVVGWVGDGKERGKRMKEKGQ